MLLLSHARTKNGITVLSRIANYSPQDTAISLSLYVDGRVFDAKKVDVRQNEVENVYWTGIPTDALSIECRIDAEDSLLADNCAWNAVNPSRRAKVLLVSERNIFLEKILS